MCKLYYRVLWLCFATFASPPAMVADLLVRHKCDFDADSFIPECVFWYLIFPTLWCNQHMGECRCKPYKKAFNAVFFFLKFEVKLHQTERHQPGEVVKMCSCILIVVIFNLISYDQTVSLLIFHLVSIVIETDSPRASLNE